MTAAITAPVTNSAIIPPGVYHGLSNSEYHAAPGLSNSGMKDLAVSPLRYWYNFVNPAPKPEDEEETKSQRMGSALHCAVLESEATFESRYVRELDPSDWPVCLDTVGEIRAWVADKRGKCKGTSKDDVIASALAHMEDIGESVPILQVEKSRFFAMNEGKTVLGVDEWDRLAGMIRAISEEPALRPILSNGKPEVSIFAIDPETGVLCKARLDWMAPRHTLDLKSFTAKRGASIDKSIHDAIYYEGYYRQAYWYDFVRRLATGEDHDRSTFVEAFVESQQPHETRIKSFMPKLGGNANLYWLMAHQECRALVRKYAECVQKFGVNPWREDCRIEPLEDGDLRQIGY
jgi:PDDEXK-like uncharacterized protein DUF3799